MNILKSLFGIGPRVDFAELVKEGAIIVDVRTRKEYLAGHIEGSRNIPLDQLNVVSQQIPNLSGVIVTCCASGGRSAAACATLKSKGYAQVYNGGAWTTLKSKL